MAQVTQAICDQCGAVKGETNHWVNVIVQPDVKEITILPAIQGGAWPHNLDLCGVECTLKAIAKRVGAWHTATQTAELPQDRNFVE